MQFPVNQNAYQNIGQANVNGFSNNLRYCDVGQVTAEEFNTKIGSSREPAPCEPAALDDLAPKPR
jgi:3-isopropylmalate dehydratase small subunit